MKCELSGNNNKNSLDLSRSTVSNNVVCKDARKIDPCTEIFFRAELGEYSLSLVCNGVLSSIPSRRKSPPISAALSRRQHLPRQRAVATRPPSRTIAAAAPILQGEV